MMANISIPNWFVLLGLSTALVIATGCNAERFTSTTESDRTSITRPLKDMEKDLKPPVVIKADQPSRTGMEPAQLKEDEK